MQNFKNNLTNEIDLLENLLIKLIKEKTYDKTKNKIIYFYKLNEYKNDNKNFPKISTEFFLKKILLKK